MKSYVTLSLIGTSLLLFAGCSDSTASIEFEDSALEEAILEAVDSEGETVTAEEAASVETLDASDAGIEKIAGIEQLENLTDLNLAGNAISDFSPLDELEHLEELHAGDVFITETMDDSQWELLEQLEEDGIEVNARVRLSVEDPEDEPSKGIFLTVSEGNQTVYLLGSIHVGDENLYPLHNEIEEAFDKADHLAVEIDMADIDEMEITSYMMQEGMYTDGTALSDVLDEDVYEEAVSHLSEFGMTSSLVDSYKPWFVSMLLTDVALMETDFSGEHGIDNYFMERAHNDGLPVISLESIESQLETISGAPEEEQIESLEATVEGYDVYEEDTRQLINLWRSGNSELLTYLREMDNETDQLALDERDVAMTDQIEEFLQEDNGDTYFVVVGAMHLVGDNSIAGLLEQRGYHVETPEGF
ncbi:TraB/GumN family protein [Salipaludibacillus agaradhaerens]|uniref:TraB/GumN family protein n=1 Tax=Salipaludibacillus agaradhaerens TaxID=76935 RepID=UPI002151EA44|nr:TraB/GumN family protein [Salipaludibacillus agaradhaerens]MCR6105788.1 TraB/GumN family protein [Salipaludibacillus agaradhaerens]MCR6117824.1 TraB/GumN family protein [Salipaludibacillus agaradhaerens]